MDHSVQGMTVLIPSLEPDVRLIEYVDTLTAIGFQEIIVVDDGSGEIYQPVFFELEKRSNCCVLHHTENRGKGMALKTGYRYILNEMKESPSEKWGGVITADSDGQHLASDVRHLAELVTQYPTSLLLGGRNFSGKDVPFRSWLGNRLTSGAFFMLCRRWLPDTQTGLRAFDKALLPFMLNVAGERFEYEMQVLLECVRNQVPLVTIPITTVYENDNRGTHYHPFRDSMKIMKVLLHDFLKFFLSSIVSCLVDLSIAWILLDGLKGYLENDFLRIFLATVGARTISMLTNYSLNRKYVFRSRERWHSRFGRYLALCVCMMILSAISVYSAHRFIGIDEKLAKLVCDSLLFLLSFQAQNRWVFAEKESGVEV